MAQSLGVGLSACFGLLGSCSKPFGLYLQDLGSQQKFIVRSSLFQSGAVPAPFMCVPDALQRRSARERL